MVSSRYCFFVTASVLFVFLFLAGRKSTVPSRNKSFLEYAYKQQMQRYAKAVKEQQELNEQLASEGLINEVNDDWEETEKSPALQDK